MEFSTSHMRPRNVSHGREKQMYVTACQNGCQCVWLATVHLIISSPPQPSCIAGNATVQTLRDWHDKSSNNIACLHLSVFARCFPARADISGELSFTVPCM